MIDSIHMDVSYVLDTSDSEEKEDLSTMIEAIKEAKEVQTEVVVEHSIACVHIRYYTHELSEKVRSMLDNMWIYIETLYAKELRVKLV